jgi:cell division protein FtsW
MVFSASAPTALAEKNDSFFYLKTQSLYALFGLLMMGVFSMIDYHLYAGKAAIALLVVSCLLLAAVFLPKIGVAEYGAHRWISLGFTSFQPSEIAKIALIVFFADRLSQPGESLRIQSFWKLFSPYLLCMGVVLGELIVEPHLSGSIIVAVICLILLACGGARKRHLAGVAAIGAGGAWIAINYFGYMKDRLLAFVDPFKYAKDQGYQIVQSLYAIATGGFFGRGYFKSVEKYLYLPEQQNDYIFSIFAEEFGFLGVVIVIVLFVVLIWRGLKISYKAHDMFGALIALGITSLIGFQALMNIAVVTSSVPSTGVSLPFISAGGTSLVILMSAVGVLINVSKHSDYDLRAEPAGGIAKKAEAGGGHA